MKKIISLLICIIFTASSAFAYTDIFVEREYLGKMSEEKQEEVSFIVELEGGGLLSRKQSSFYGASVENFEENILCSMEEEAQNPIAEAEKITGEEITVRYTHLLNGFSIEGDISLKDELEKIDGVKHVGISQTLYFEATNENNLITSPDHAKQDLRIGLTEELRGKYTGDGIVIGVIDSELCTDHEAFNTAPKTIALTKEKIAQILDSENLIAETKIEGLNAEDVYKNNGKVPFVFDYAENDADPTSSSSNIHGTHVSAIAAGNSENFKGVAPDSQIVFMKVAKDGASSVNEIYIIAALEDMVKLKVDVINLSIGIPAGFTGLSNYNNVFELIRNEGIVVSMSAGNNGRFGEKRVTFAPMADFPDYGMISIPAAYEYPTAVASVNVSEAEEESKMSSFSSWGVAYDLRLKPEITAAGGNIVSAGLNGKYMYMNGTSMATPQYAGSAGVMLQYLKEDVNSAYPKATAQSIAQRLLASTADIEYDESKPVSPRKQGAGVINLTKATNDLTLIYNGDKTKIELGEITNDADGLKTAKPFTFTIQNLSAETVDYNLSAVVMTDAYEKNSSNVNIVKDAKVLENSELAFKIDGVIVSEISLEPFASKEITAEVLLDENEIAELTQVFKNGFYIEGFITAENDAKAVSIPYMGFYGDWGKIPVFNGDVTESKPGYVGHTGLYSKDNKNNIGFLNYSLNTDNLYYSPNGGEDLILFSDNMRNLERLNIVIKDKDDKTVFSGGKSYVYKNYELVVKNSQGTYERSLSLDNSVVLADKETQLSDGVYNVTYTGILPDGINTESGSFNLCVDSVYPYIKDAYYKIENGKAYLYVLGKDNAVNPLAYIIDGNNNRIDYASIDENGYFIFDMTGYSMPSCKIAVADAAGNGRAYNILPANGYAAAYMGNALSRVNKFSALVSGGLILNKPVFTPEEGERVRFFAWNNKLMPLTSGN
ncbi:MAG: S8 family serine peptidase [Clostridia bacterium]|nr:S8 family serine peptidase [Clostridia bacterium]